MSLWSNLFGSSSPTNLEPPKYHLKTPVEERWYVVFVGLNPGLYKTAAEALAQTNGVPRQKHCVFPNQDEALKAFEDGKTSGLVEKALITRDKAVLTCNDLPRVDGLKVDDHPDGYTGPYWVVLCGRRIGLFRNDVTAAYCGGVSNGHVVRLSSFDAAVSSFMKEMEAGNVVKDTTAWSYEALEE